MSRVSLLAIAATFALVGIIDCQQLNFSNPISHLNFHGVNDLSIFHLDSNYYLIATDDTNYRQILMLKSGILTSFQNATWKTFCPFPSGCEMGQLRIGKMHILNGNLYLYFSRFEDGEPKMYGIRAQNSSDPMGEWDAPVAMITDWNLDKGILGGTVMTHGESNYLVFIRFINIGEWNGIYITKMTSPTNTSGPTVMIRNATEERECHSGCRSEAPAFFYNGNVSYLIFSVNSHHSINRSLTQMSIPFEKDPMDPTNWEQVAEPVFGRNENENVFMRGYASFTDSPDGTETWMMYQANDSPIWANITARVDKISWNPDASPKFPIPHGLNHSQPVPSGQTYT